MLNKALNIAEIRNPGADDGTVARIMWKLADVLKELHVNAEEGEEMATRAMLIRREITGRTLATGEFVDKNYDEMEDAYDALVSGFFR